jgi:hypothetical protein
MGGVVTWDVFGRVRSPPPREPKRPGARRGLSTTKECRIKLEEVKEGGRAEGQSERQIDRVRPSAANQPDAISAKVSPSTLTQTTASDSSRAGGRGSLLCTTWISLIVQDPRDLTETGQSSCLARAYCAENMSRASRSSLPHGHLGSALGIVILLHRTKM